MKEAGGVAASGVAAANRCTFQVPGLLLPVSLWIWDMRQVSLEGIQLWQAYSIVARKLCTATRPFHAGAASAYLLFFEEKS